MIANWCTFLTFYNYFYNYKFVNNIIKIGYLSSQIKSTFFANSSHPTLLKIWCKNLKWFSSNIYLMAPWLQICPIIITQFMFPPWSTRDFKSDQKSLNINHHIFDRGSLLILGQSNLHTQLRYKFGYICKDLKLWSTTPNATEHGRQKQNIELALFLHQTPRLDTTIARGVFDAMRMPPQPPRPVTKICERNKLYTGDS